MTRNGQLELCFSHYMAISFRLPSYMYIIWEISTLLGFYSTPQMSLYVSNLIYYLVILFRSPFLIHQSKLGNVLMAVSEISCLGKWISFVVPLIAHSTYLNDILKVWPRELFFFLIQKKTTQLLPYGIAH